MAATTKLNCVKPLHKKLKSHIKFHRPGLRLEAWVAEAIREKMQRETGKLSDIPTP